MEKINTFINEIKQDIKVMHKKLTLAIDQRDNLLIELNSTKRQLVFLLRENKKLTAKLEKLEKIEEKYSDLL